MDGWIYDPAGDLALRTGERVTLVPPALAALLLTMDGHGLSPVPAIDVLRLESRLRHLAAALAVEFGQAERRLAGVRQAGEVQVPTARCWHQVLGETLRESLRHHALTGGRLRDTHALIARLRTWVIETRPESGWLAEAAEGWNRGADPPAGVTIYASEDAYLDADPRRAASTEWGGRRIDGVERWGQVWRRDGDEDDPCFEDDGMVHRDGPWAIGQVERTGDLYAIRRSSYKAREVWGLGRLDVPGANALLETVTPRIREPNSVVLAAATVCAVTRRWAV